MRGRSIPAVALAAVAWAGTIGCEQSAAPVQDIPEQTAAETLRSTAAPAGSPSLTSSDPATASGVAIDTQTEAAASSAPGRIYRAAYEQARREINSDNAYDRLQELERQIEKERQRLP